MANWIGTAAAGLKTVLETINGLRVYDTPPDAINETPAAVISLGEINYVVAIGGNAIEATFVVTVYARSAKTGEGWDDLYEFLAPAGTNSIPAAIAAATTLDGAVDQAMVESAENVQRDPDRPGTLTAEITVRWVKSS